MIICLTKINIAQQGTGRSKVLTFNFATSFEVESSWEKLTQTGKITVPKNIYYIDANGTAQTLYGPNQNIGGFTSAPWFMRGDKITIEAGYRLESGIAVTNTVFTGYISGVKSKMPIELDIEDEMFILKQSPAHGGNNNFFSGKTYTLESMIKEMLHNSGLSYNIYDISNTNTQIGDFRVQNETIAEVLGRLRKEFRLFSFFKTINGTTSLYTGSLVYQGKANVTANFAFQKNIIGDELEYKRKEDIILSATGRNTINETTGETTKDGKAKTKCKRLEVLVTMDSKSPTGYRVFVPSKGNPIPPNEGGERRDYVFLAATNTNDLGIETYNQLQRYYFDGLRGSFTTFGLPFVQQGDNANIIDPVLPERNGLYKIKSVEYSLSVSGGLRQKIHLDYRINQ